jgi:hypothetical protein
MKKYLPLIILFLSGCQLYGGASIHDRSFDSEFKDDNVITTFGISQEFNIIKNITGVIFGEHDSMPFIDEVNGYGVNKVGSEVRMRLY